MTTRICCIDIETTGLDPHRHEIFEVAMVIRDEDGDWNEWAYWIADVDLSTADANALRINRFYDRLASEPPMTEAREVAMQVAVLTSGSHLVGKNPAFDAGFLDVFLRRHGLAPAWSYHLVDVEAACAAKAGIEPPWSGDALAQAVGVKLPPAHVKHTAMGDARVARLMYEAVFSPHGQPQPPRGRRRAEPEPEPEPESETVTVADAPEPEAEPPVEPERPGPPDPAVEHRCVETVNGEQCQTMVEGEKALMSWTRYRRILCPPHFSAMKVISS